MRSASRWQIQPGDTVSREHVHEIYGGDPQAQIALSSNSADLLVYAHRGKGGVDKPGYISFDEPQQVYLYTGEGESGDQTMTDGNKAIADHHVDGTELRLLVAVGRALSGTRVYKYIARFAVDPDNPYIAHTGPGTDGVPRQAFVFRLQRVGR